MYNLLYIYTYSSVARRVLGVQILPRALFLHIYYRINLINVL